MNIRAVCSDIDGTLLNSKRQLSSRTIEAFKKIKDKVPVILASSRMPSAMTHLQAELGIESHPLICFNGGYVIHSPSENPLKILSTQHISLDVCQAIVDISTTNNLHVSLFVEDEWYAPGRDRWTEKEEMVTKVRAEIASADKILDRWYETEKGAHKVMCMGDEEPIKQVAEWLDKNYSHVIHIYRSKSTYLEIAPKTISKASALAFLLKELYHIEMNEVMAFGDNYNDIELLRAAGKGIAVENAREEVKAVANEITLKSIDDGVALSIEKYF